MVRPALALLLLLAVSGCSCGEEGGGGTVPQVNRCELDFENSPLFSRVGSGARAVGIDDPAQLVGGQAAQGQVGDVLLENDRIRVVIQRPGRNIAPSPFGGLLIDADLQRGGAPGQDLFGRFGFFYAFGRTIDATAVEILADGASGGPAVVAVTGQDALNDYVNVNSVIGTFLPGTKLVIDPDVPLPIRATTYYVLSPGENRVRVLTQFCNDGNTPVQMPVGDLVDQGGTASFFNPNGCANRPGTRSRDGQRHCEVDPSSWYGYQGEGLAYGIRSFKTDNLSVPETENTLLTLHGVVATLQGGRDQAGLLTWTEASAQRRPGGFAIAAGGTKGWLRDFVVAKDLGEIHSSFLSWDSAPRARLDVTVTGEGAAGARVEVMDAQNRMIALLVADEGGKAKMDLAAGSYVVTAGVPGRLSASQGVNVPSSGSVEASLVLPAPRRLTVNVKDPAGAPIPAKVTVFCAAGPCPNANAWTRFTDADFLPSDVAYVGYVPTSGTLTVPLPPEQYALVVTRGPEHSAWPDTWRPVEVATAHPLNLQSADVAVDATIARVVDSAGWMSADLHVHAVNSPDSSVPNELRVASYLAEGVDILCSTDHDFVTDFAPFNEQLAGQPFLATLIGEEVTSMDFGHYNAYPISRDPASTTGGALDWAGGPGPTLRLDQLFAQLRERHPDTVVQFNHPRSGVGAMGYLQVDTATGATHAEPALFRMEAAADATASDTRLFSFGFDAVEIQNGLALQTPMLNDWFTWLSTGRVKTATAVSDTHSAYSTAAGYSRTFVRLGADAPAQLSGPAFAQAVKARRAIGTNGPFVRFTAQRLDGAGAPTGPLADVGDTLSVSAGAQLQLTVDVQGPEWMTFDRIEIFTHGDGRAALGGLSNETAPAPVATATLNLATLPIEPVAGLPGSFRRVHVTERFTVTAAADTWFVAVVRSSSAARLMFPLAWDGTRCDSGLCTASSARPNAFTNAILIDADGSGAYDDFPLKPPPPLPRSAPPPSGDVRSSAERLGALLDEIVQHSHH